MINFKRFTHPIIFRQGCQEERFETKNSINTICNNPVIIFNIKNDKIEGVL